MRYTKYNTITGELLGWGKGEQSQIDRLASRNISVVIDDIETDVKNKYIDPLNLSNGFIDRPDHSMTINKTTLTADLVDEVIISNCEVGATYEISGPETYLTGTLTDTTLDFSTDDDGVFTIRIEAFPAKKGIFEVTAT